MRNSKILVTGGTGLIGFYITSLLICMNDELHLGNEIIIHGRKLSRLEGLYGEKLKRKDVKCYISNLDEEQIFVGDIDYVIHAAMPSASLKFIDPVGVMKTAIEGTEHIADLALSHNAKSLLYISSVTIYGDISNGENISEDFFDRQDWRNDNNAYMLGKRGAEFVLLSKYRSSNLPVKIIRPGYIYGANPLDDNRVYNNFISTAAKGCSIEMKSDGQLIRPLVYVVDVVKAVFMVLASNVNGEAYNVAGAEMSLKEFYEICSGYNKIEKSSYHDSSINTQKIELNVGWHCTKSHKENILSAIKIKKRMNEI